MIDEKLLKILIEKKREKSQIKGKPSLFKSLLNINQYNIYDLYYLIKLRYKLLEL